MLCSDSIDLAEALGPVHLKFVRSILSPMLCRLAKEYTNGTLLHSKEVEKPLKGRYGLLLPNDKMVPLEDPNDMVEIAHKTATLGGEFNYYDKDYVEFNGTDIRQG